MSCLRLQFSFGSQEMNSNFESDYSDTTSSESDYYWDPKPPKLIRIRFSKPGIPR
eukprot:Awhi_evm1s14445